MPYLFYENWLKECYAYFHSKKKKKECYAYSDMQER